MKVTRVMCLYTLVLLGTASAVAAQEYGNVTGQVTDEASGAPLPAVQIQVAGTNLGGLTNQTGRYLLHRVPLGTQTIRAVRIGYAQMSQTVTITGGETAVADFRLGQSAVVLEGLMVTATGTEQRSREVGVAVGKVNMEDVPLAANATVADALQARVPGVTVTEAGGTTGTGSRIRIRGSASVSLNNDPLVVIDGVRASNSTGNSIDVGGQNTSRLDDISSEDIEKIEVLKGPAASALYGTAAANGVIVITTKKGMEGATRWRAYAEGASLVEPNRYPTNFNGWCSLYDSGGEQVSGDIGICDTAYLYQLQEAYAGVFTVQMDSIQSYNPLEAKGQGPYPFQSGLRQKYGVSAQGGTSRATYFVSGDWTNEKGVYKDVSLLRNLNLRTNLSAQLTDALDASVRVGYVNSDVRLPQNDNNVLGILPSAYFGGGTVEEAYGFFTLPDLQAINTHQKVTRFIGSAQMNLNPTSWLSFNGVAGMDLIQRHDNETLPPERVFYASYSEGERTSNRIELGTYTGQLNGSAEFTLRGNIGSKTNIGIQYVDEKFSGTYAYGRGLLAGCSSLNCVATGFSVDEQTTDVKTFGAYVSQQFSLNDRLFITGTLRGDDNSAFGRNLDLTLYPSTNVSWVIGEEPWFPAVPALSLLRLRAGYGVSGLQPGFRTATRYLDPAATVIQGAVVPAFTFGGVGNPDLKPEISKELELGVDLGLFKDRYGLELTYFNKKSHDALVDRNLPPSLGIATTQTINIGKVQNSGFEALVHGTVINRPDVVWDATVSYSTIRNRLLDLGIDPNTGEAIQPIIFGLGGDSQRFQEGFPLGGYWARSYTYDDANHDGIIQTDEVTLSDTAQYQGWPFPTREASFQSSVTLFKLLRLSALMDYKGGFKLFNGTADFRCASFYNCRSAYAGYPGVNVSLADQAAYVADAYGPSGGTIAGYIQDATFWKLREVTATISLPKTWASRFRSQGASLTIAGRNLGTWTKYGGADPELNGNGSGSNFSTFDFLTQPPIRYYTIRLDLIY